MNFTVNWYERLPSTNTFLKEMVILKDEVPSGMVIAAREQTQGRGRLDRSWLSGANENLTFSLFLRGEMDAGKWPSSSMAAAIAVAETLQEKSIRASLKWPNDVLVDGRKICGILAERIPQGLIIGMGLNVNMQSADHIDQPATSMRMEVGKRYDIDKLLKDILGHLSIWLDIWQQNGFAGIRQRWKANVPNLGETVTVRDGDMQRSGILTDFGENGELFLSDKAGNLHVIWAGDLFTDHSVKTL